MGASCGAHELPAGYSPEKIALQFANHIARPLPVDLRSSSELKFRKWARPPDVAVSNIIDGSRLGSDFDREWINSTISQVSEVSGIQISGISESAKRPHIVFVPFGKGVSDAHALRTGIDLIQEEIDIDPSIGDLERLVENKPDRCTTYFFSVKPDIERDAYRVVIIVRISKSALENGSDDFANHCFVEEIGHALSFFNDIDVNGTNGMGEFDTIFNSTFGSATDRSNLSDADVALMQIVGGPLLENGARIQDAVDIVYDLFSSPE